MDKEELIESEEAVMEILDKIVKEIEDTGAYKQEVSGKTEFLEGIDYCLSVINKYKVESEKRRAIKND